MHRFFVPPSALKQQPVVLAGEQAHQLQRVLRLRTGERLVLLDNSGWAYECELQGYGAGGAELRVIERRPARGESKIDLTLFQAVLKGDSFGYVLQKCTELGVNSFVPMICERNVVDNPDAIEQKRPRWERIIQEAAEQSGRARLPRLEAAQPFAGAVQRDLVDGESQVVRLIPWEGERAVSLHGALSKCNLVPNGRIQVFVGPEGGFTANEVHLARTFRIEPVSLGPRVLRAETAGLVTAAAIFYQAGEMAPPTGD